MTGAQAIGISLISFVTLLLVNSDLLGQSVTRYRDRLEILVDSESSPTNDVIALESDGLGTFTLTINQSVWIFSGDIPLFEIVDLGGDNRVRIEGSFDASSFDLELGGTNQITFDHVGTSGDVDMDDFDNGHRCVIDVIDCSFDDFEVVFSETTCSLSVADSDFWKLKIWTDYGIDLLQVTNTYARFLEFDALQYLVARFSQVHCVEIDNITTPELSDVRFEDSVSGYTRSNGGEITFLEVNNYITSYLLHDSDWWPSTVSAAVSITDSFVDHSAITTGSGHDNVTVTNTSFDGDLAITTKGGHDKIVFNHVESETLLVSSGDGADTIRLSEYEAYGLAEVNTINNNDVIVVTRSLFRSDLNIKSGSGVDHIFLSDGNFFAEDLLIDSGRSDDLLVVSGTEVDGDTNISTDDGFDQLTWSRNSSVGDFYVEMGRNDDELTLEDSTFKGSLTVRGESGSRDTGNELNNSIAGSITKSGFEIGNLN